MIPVKLNYVLLQVYLNFTGIIRQSFVDFFLGHLVVMLYENVFRFVCLLVLFICLFVLFVCLFVCLFVRHNN